MSQTQQTTDEILDSLTGHEEDWIFDQFGKSIGELVSNFLDKNDLGPYFRALIFVLKRRDGVNEDDARNEAKAMKLGEVMEFFPRASDQASKEDAEAVEESGKGEPAHEPEPQPSLSSVS